MLIRGRTEKCKTIAHAVYSSMLVCNKIYTLEFHLSEIKIIFFQLLTALTPVVNFLAKQNNTKNFSRDVLLYSPKCYILRIYFLWKVAWLNTSRQKNDQNQGSKLGFLTDVKTLYLSSWIRTDIIRLCFVGMFITRLR